MYVSVVMPTHNRQGYVGQAIESVLKQQHVEFELIIVDDASTDGTLEGIDRYARQDHRIRVAQHAENKGLAVSLNEGLELAKHDLVARMAADAVILRTGLHRQLRFLAPH